MISINMIALSKKINDDINSYSRKRQFDSSAIPFNKWWGGWTIYRIWQRHHKDSKNFKSKTLNLLHEGIHKFTLTYVEPEPEPSSRSQIITDYETWTLTAMMSMCILKIISPRPKNDLIKCSSYVHHIVLCLMDLNLSGWMSSRTNWSSPETPPRQRRGWENNQRKWSDIPVYKNSVHPFF